MTSDKAREPSNDSEELRQAAGRASRGLECLLAGKHRQAARLLSLASAVLHRYSGVPVEGRALCDQGLGQALFELGNYAAAERAYVDAWNSYREVGDQEEVRSCAAMAANCALSLGLKQSEAGNYQAAVAQLGSAKAAFQQLGEQGMAAFCGVWIGKSELLLEHYGAALQEFATARRHYEATGDSEQVEECDDRLGFLHLRLAEYAQARQVLMRLRRGCAARHDDAGMARYDGLVAVAHLRLHDYRRAYGAMARAQRTYVKLGRHRDAARCAVGLGNALRELGRDAEAMQAYTFSKSALGKDDELAAANCDQGLAYVLRTQGDYEAAWRLLTAAVEVYRQHPDIWIDTALCDLDRAWLRLAMCSSSTGGQVTPQVSDEALKLVVPAVLALDSVRFQLSGTAGRQRWAHARVTRALGMALEIAALSGDTDLVAELIETTRAFGRLDLPEAEAQSAAAIEVWLTAAAAGGDQSGTPDRDGDPAVGDGGEGGPAATLSGGLPVGGDAQVAGLRLQPPGRIHLPWHPSGLVALASHHEIAVERYQRSNTAVGVIYRLNAVV